MISGGIEVEHWLKMGEEKCRSRTEKPYLQSLFTL